MFENKFTVKTIKPKSCIDYMVKSGMVRKISSGIYAWMPYGFKCIQKLNNLIRKEIESLMYQEVILPIILPSCLIKTSGRLDKFGSELLTSSNLSMYAAPTSEEAVIECIKHFITSYKDLPIRLFQITEKFRDEFRPKSGLIRCKSFLMKDAYSFHASKQDLQQEYNIVKDAYIRIFNKLNIPFFCIKADTGAIGGSNSHEFQIPLDIGQDSVLYTHSYSAKLEHATHLEGVEYLDNNINCFEYEYNSKSIFFLIKECHTINPHKIGHNLVFKRKLDYIPITNVIVDKSAFKTKGFTHINKDYLWKDISILDVKDIRFTTQGDYAPDGSGKLQFTKTVEIGHIYQLDNTYSCPMNLTVMDSNNKKIDVQMGCYGIGIGRLIACCFQSNNYILPLAISPYLSIIVCLHIDPIILEAAKKIKQDYQCLIDDRLDSTPSQKLYDAKLMGCPYIIILGKQFIIDNIVEIQDRLQNTTIKICIEQAINFVYTISQK